MTRIFPAGVLPFVSRHGLGKARTALFWMAFLPWPALSLLVPAARAHAPHDVVHIVEVSPEFARDRTVFAVINLSDHHLLARSMDGGRSWLEYASPVVHQWIVDLALSPAYLQDGTLFAATKEGGIWRSTDHGLTWKAVNTGLTTMGTTCVAVSPGYAVNRTVLACTNDGLFRSADGGDSWTQVTSGLVEPVITASAFVPGDPLTAYAGRETVHRSTDGGITWSPLQAFPHPMDAIAISPRFKNDRTMAVTFGRYPDGVLGSKDGGATWQPALQGLTDMTVNDVTISDDGTVFAVTKTQACFRAPFLLAPWTLYAEGFEKLSDQTENHFVSVAVSPVFSRDQTVYVGAFEGIFKSADRGEHWRQGDVYNQQLCRRVVPSPGYGLDKILFAGNYGGGPYAMKDLGTTVEWEALGGSIHSLWCSVFLPSPAFATDQTLFYGYLGLWRSKDAGETWTKLYQKPKIPRDVALSPDYASDQTLYLGSGGEGSYLSPDGGNTWVELQGGLPPELKTTSIRLPPLFPADPTVYITSSDQGIWRSADAGISWFPISDAAMADNVRDLALSPDFASDGLVLAGTVRTGLFRSDDRGDTWFPLNDGFPSGPDNVIESLAFSPDFAVDSTVFVVSFYDGVYKSTDGGWTFAPAKTGLTPAAPRKIAISPEFGSDQTVFLSTHDWLWRSLDGGGSWERLPGFNRVDDCHPAIFYEGDWSIQGEPDSFTQKVTLSGEANAFLELEFKGDTITWYALKSPFSGVAEVSLDGKILSRVDLYSPTPLAQHPVITKSFSGVGWHKIRIRVTGAKNPAAQYHFIYSDGFAYTF